MRENFTEKSVRHFATKLLCRTHGLQEVAAITEHGTATLHCGCVRRGTLAVTDGSISFEHFSRFASQDAQRAASLLFPTDTNAVSELKLGAGVSEFKTRTIGLASFLRYAGIPHIATIRVYQKSYEFVFADPEDACRRLEYEYLSGCSVADAMALLEADKQLKQTIKIASLNGEWRSDA